MKCSYCGDHMSIWEAVEHNCQWQAIYKKDSFTRKDFQTIINALNVSKMANKPNVKLIGINLMVMPKKAEEKTSGGLYIPEDAKIQPNEGVVIARGPDCKTVQVGDYIHYVRSRGTKIMHGDQELIIIQESEHDILVIDNEAS